MRRWLPVPDTFLSVAVCLLLSVVASRGVVGLLAPEPVRALDILRGEATRFPRGRLLLLADSAHTRWLGDAAAAARRRSSGLPLEVHILGPDDRAVEPIRRLVRAYGMEHLPVLLTLDAEARVLRVEPLSPPPSLTGS